VTTAEAGKTDTNRSDENPSFLNASLTAKANTVLYDNLTLKDVSGKLIVKDEANYGRHKTSVLMVSLA
jgi:hypothetical protein